MVCTSAVLPLFSSHLPNSSSATSEVPAAPAARPKGHTKSASMSQSSRATDLPPVTGDADYRPTQVDFLLFSL